MEAETQTRGGRKSSKAEIFEVAIDCFARYGFQGTSIDRIAREAGVTKGALYHHFKNKDELLLGAVDDQLGRFQQKFVGKVGAEPPAEDAIDAAVEACAGLAERSNPRRFILTLMVEALDQYPEISERFRAMMRGFRSYLRRAIRKGQREGIYRSDVDPALAASVFASGLLGAELQYYQDPDAVRLRPAMQAVAEQLRAWLAPVPRPKSKQKSKKRE